MFRLFFSYCFLTFIYMVFFTQVYAQSSNALHVNGIRIWHAPDYSRIVFDISKTADYSISLLDKPDRYVINFQSAKNQATIPAFVENQRIKKITIESLNDNRLRYVIPLKRALRSNVFQLAPNKVYGHRLVIDLFDIENNPTAVAKTPKDQSQLPSNQTLKNVTSEKSVSQQSAQSIGKSDKSIQNSSFQNYATSVSLKKQTIVAIDAGHGGEDPGALGSRSREKNVTLSIAKRLAKIINKNPQMKAVLIRTNDYFIRLRNRTNKARKAQADLFISIHADAALNKSARGMSVFALSQRGATSELARALARKENQADLVGGVSIKDKDDALAEVLLDLSMTHKISESVDLGAAVLKKLSKIGKLHSKRVEQAGFVVLKSPDIPSILVETGFITNRSEEKLLLSSKHQQRIAESIYQGVVEYVRQNPTQLANAKYQLTSSDYQSVSFDADSSSISAQQATQYHLIKSGDSLSQIAFQYGISLKQLKQWNKLKSDVAFKGQRLRVSALAEQSSLQSNSQSVPKMTKTTITHKVRSGDTLSDIAQKYGASMNAIRQTNKLRNSNIYIGQRLKIVTNRVAQSNSSLSAKSNSQSISVHIVKSGEFLSSISKRYNITIKELKQLNNLRSNKIYVGQKLSLSNTLKSNRPQNNQLRTIKHTVISGQTLSGLALKYKVKQSDIVSWNKLKKRQLLIGQRLVIKVRS